MKPNADQKKNIGIVGCGYWGKNLVRNFHALGVLGAVCDNNQENLNRIKNDYDVPLYLNSYDELLANQTITAVVISAPAEAHTDLVEKALLSGKDVFVEKPLSLDVPSGEKLVKLAKEKKKILMVGHLLWYHPAILKLKELITSGELGRIRYIYSNRLNLGKIRQEENILWSFAPHDISVILGLLEEMPNEIIAQGGNYLKKDIADVTVSCFSFPSGKKAHIFVSWLHPFKEQKMIVVGEKKMAVFNDLEKEDKLFLYPHTVEWKGNIPVYNKANAEPISLDSTEPLRSECQHFLDCLQSRKTPRTDGEEALRVLSVLDACQKALETSVPLSSQPQKVFSPDRRK